MSSHCHGASPESRVARKDDGLEGQWLMGARAAARLSLEPLEPVFADHDRSSHAERSSLLAILRCVGAKNTGSTGSMGGSMGCSECTEV